MWSTIANLKENLNKIALDVHDDEEDELQIYSPVAAAEDPSVSDRRVSHNYAHSNGIDSVYNSEVICLNVASSLRKWNCKVSGRFSDLNFGLLELDSGLSPSVCVFFWKELVY